MGHNEILYNIYITLERRGFWSSGSWKMSGQYYSGGREFRIPSHLQDLELPGGWIRSEEATTVPSDVAQQRELLEAVEAEVDALGFVSVAQSVVALETLYRLVRDASKLGEPESLVKLLLSVLEDAASQTKTANGDDESSAEQALTARNALLISAYLCHSAFVGLESWQESTLSAFGACLGRADLGVAWSMGVVDESFLLLWVRVGGRGLMKGYREAGREVIVAALRAAPASSAFGASAAQALVEDVALVGEKEAASVAQACAATGEDRGDYSLAGHVLRELARLAEEKTSGKCAAAFVEELSSKSPATCAAHLSTLTTDLLDAAPAYSTRSASVIAVGRVLEADAKCRQQHDDEGKKRLLVNDAARDAILQVLLDRRFDISHFVRAASLRAWASLVEKRALPISWQANVGRAAAGERLVDKSALVRRAALNLLVRLLEYNPYGATLDPVPFLTEAHKKLEQREKLYPTVAEGEEEDEEARASRRQLEREENYFRSAADFVDSIEMAAERVKVLTRSSTAGDAVGAARFFGVARDFGLPCGAEGLQLVLPLVCSHDDTVKAEAARVVTASVLAPDSRESARRACNLVARCAQQDLACLEQLVKQSSQKKNEELLTSPRLVRALWQIAADPDDNRTVSKSQRAAAVRFLAVTATAIGSQAVETSALPELTRRVVDPATGKLDTDLALALACLLRDGCGGEKAHKRRAAIHSAAALRLALLRRSSSASRWWYAAADATLVATFALDPKPESAAADFVRGLATQCDTAGDLSRLLHVAGHVGLQLAASAENLGISAAVSSEKREEDDDDDELEKGLGGLGASERGAADHEALVAALVENDVVGGENNSLADLGRLAARVVEAALADEKNEVPPVLQRSAALALAKLMCVSRKFCEAHLPVLVTTLVRGRDAGARVNVAVALGDLAARQPNSLEPWTDHVYSALCDKDTEVRGAVLATLARLALNDMIKTKGAGVAQLALRVVDPDPAIRRRAKAFFHELHRKSTATHSPVYNLLPDVISRLSAARRGKASATSSEDDGIDSEAHIGEFPSAVAAEDASCSPEDFQTVLGFLLKFVEKEKHVEALAEKICQRISATRAEDDAALQDDGAASVDIQAETRRDLAFCLTKLQVTTEKNVRRIVELLPLYRHALVEDDVLAAFQGIAQKAKKGLKLPTDSLQIITDWEAVLAAIHADPTVADDDDEEDDLKGSKTRLQRGQFFILSSFRDRRVLQEASRDRLLVEKATRESRQRGRRYRSPSVAKRRARLTIPATTRRRRRFGLRRRKRKLGVCSGISVSLFTIYAQAFESKFQEACILRRLCRRRGCRWQGESSNFKLTCSERRKELLFHSVLMIVPHPQKIYVNNNTCPNLPSCG